MASDVGARNNKKRSAKHLSFVIETKPKRWMCHTGLSQSHKRVRFCQLVAKWDQMAKISGPVDDLIADQDWPWLAIFFQDSRRLHKIALFFMCRIPKGLLSI
jgi:hypothetical protein